MRVVSVNVGRPVPLGVAGEIVASAIGKQPVAGPVAVARTNLAGDEQGDKVNHGGPEQAAYAYAAEDAAWWGAQLGRPLRPGAFGENLTLEGVDVSGALIGERWRVGTAELRVAGPRVPCQKLATQIGDPAFVRRFTLALRPGAYLAVAREGELQAGDELDRAPPGARRQRRAGARGAAARAAPPPRAGARPLRHARKARGLGRRTQAQPRRSGRGVGRRDRLRPGRLVRHSGQ